MRKILPVVVILVSLCMIAIPTSVTGDPPPNWDTVYGVDGVFPDVAVPLWTRTESGGKWSRTITFGDDILNFTRDDGLATISLDQYARSDSFDRNLGWQIEVRAKNIAGDSCILSLYNGDGGETKIQWDASASTIIVAGTSIGSGDSYSIGDEYNVIRMIGLETMTSVVPTEIYVNETLVETYDVYWKSAPTDIKFGCGVANTNDGHFELDYVAYDLDSKTDRQRDIEDLQNQIDELERRIKELEKQIHSDNPVVVNETNLPCIPRDGRGTLEYDTVFIDPHLVTVYDLLTFKTGSNLPFYLIYPSTSDEVTVLEDWIHLEETSYTRIWVNDTVGASELLNTTDAVGPFNLEYGYNITVQTSGASSSVRADRTSTVRLIDAFEWGESTQTGIFATKSKIENDLGFEDMSNVLVRWAFPTEDSNNREVDINMASVEVWDNDNNLELDRGRHYSLDESSVIMELRWLNVSESRTFRIQFQRESLIETIEYFVVRDNDISISDAYQNAPFTTNVHFTASGRAFFEGTLIIRFDLTGRYSGEHIDVRTLRIKRSDSSLSQQYTYDSISNELRITDQSVDCGSSVTYTLSWGWYDEKSAVYELILGDPLILYSLLLLAGFSGLFIYLDSTKEEKRRKYAGILIIVVDVIILVIVLLA